MIVIISTKIIIITIIRLSKITVPIKTTLVLFIPTYITLTFQDPVIIDTD